VRPLTEQANRLLRLAVLPEGPSDRAGNHELFCRVLKMGYLPASIIAFTSSAERCTIRCSYGVPAAMIHECSGCSMSYFVESYETFLSEGSGMIMM
jgi:hypothetical protein